MVSRWRPGTATTEASAVPLVMAMVRLVSGGIVSRSACGSTTSTNAPIRLAPSTMAADSRSCGIPAMNERNSHSA